MISSRVADGSSPRTRYASASPTDCDPPLEAVDDPLAEFDAETDRELAFGTHPKEAARPLEYALAAAAAVDPAAVRTALEARYPSVDAFTEAFPTEHRETIGRRLDGEP